MTPRERSLVLALATVPGRGAPMTAEVFLRELGTPDVEGWAWDLLQDAVARRDPDQLELILMAAHALTFAGPRWGPPLMVLLDADWHRAHHDLVGWVEELVGVPGVPALVRATQWEPAYLEVDERPELARKAVHALGRLPGPDSLAALVALQDHEDEWLRDVVRRQLARRSVE